MNNDEKIDEILLLVRKLNEQNDTSNSDDIKERVKNFMLENFNIRWLNDEVEGDIYEYLIEGILGILKIVL
jgi:hypothetical protein